MACLQHAAISDEHDGRQFLLSLDSGVYDVGDYVAYLH